MKLRFRNLNNLIRQKVLGNLNDLLKYVSKTLVLFVYAFCCEIQSELFVVCSFILTGISLLNAVSALSVNPVSYLRQRSPT